MRDVDTLALLIAAAQHGLITRAQLQAIGVDDSAIRRRTRTGLLEPVRHGVHRMPTSADRWLQEVTAAVLGADRMPPVPRDVVAAVRTTLGPAAALRFEPRPPPARLRGRPTWVPGVPVPRWVDQPPVVVGCQSAATIHDLESLAGPVPSLLVPHGRTRVRGAVVHQLDDLAAVDVARHGPLLVTEAARTIVDMAAVASPARLRVAIESAHSRKVTTVTRVGEVLARVARRGKPGVIVLGRVLDQMQRSGVSMSELEAAFVELMLAGGLPLPTQQVPLPGRQTPEQVADFAYGDAMLILEVDGRSWHGRHRDMVRDRQRDTDAARAGWLTLRFMHPQLRDDPDYVLESIAETRRDRLRLLGRCG